MKISWLGHASFALEADGYRIVTDPYQDVPGLPDLHTQAHRVYCSHDHFDHAFTQGVTLLPERESPFTVREIATFHDPEQGALRGPNTIRVFSADGVSVAHLGDLGHSLSDAQLAAIGPCDAILIPIGGVYTLDPWEAKAEAAKLKARVVIPMHYRRGSVGFTPIATVDEFTGLYPPQQVQFYEESSLELTPSTPAQVAVLALPSQN